MCEQKKKILIVDDEFNLREILSSVLINKNFEVLEASDGQEAFEIYKITAPDLVIMDLLMPVEDGLSATKRIKAFDNDAKIIILSAIDETETEHLLNNFNIYAYILKPYDMDHLVALIKKAVGLT